MQKFSYANTCFSSSEVNNFARVCNSSISRPETIISPLLASDGNVVDPFPQTAAELTRLRCTFLFQYESQDD